MTKTKANGKESSVKEVAAAKKETKVKDTGIPELDRLGFFKFLPPFILQPVFLSAFGAAGAICIYKKGNTEVICHICSDTMLCVCVSVCERLC